MLLVKELSVGRLIEHLNLDAPKLGSGQRAMRENIVQDIRSGGKCKEIEESMINSTHGSSLTPAFIIPGEKETRRLHFKKRGVS